MSEEQLDLFALPKMPVTAPPAPRSPPSRITEIDDAALIAAIADASLGDAEALAAEAGRRRLAAAVPALVALCGRFAGYGIHRSVPEQVAALDALAAVGGRDAATAVTRMIERAVVQGPTLNVALAAASRLRAVLAIAVLAALLRHDDPHIRAAACRCVRPHPELIARLIDLLDDLHPEVVRSAACALGEQGRIEARPALTTLLRNDPSEAVIVAIAPVADEEGLMLLARIARSGTSLAAAVRDAIADSDHPRAAAIAAALAGASVTEH